MKKSLLFVLSFILMFGIMSSMAFAVDSSQKYDFDIKVNGNTSAAVQVGDEVTVKVVLKGNPSPFEIYALQDELIYDSSCLALVDGSESVADGFRFSVRNMENGISNKIILSYVSMAAGGKTAEDGLVIGVFKMKVLKAGSHTLESVNYKMSVSNGLDVYESTSNNVIIQGKSGGGEGGGVIVDTYKISFDSNGGSIIASQTVNSGGKAVIPTPPVKTGYKFAGWFTDKACTEAFDFGTAVAKDLTLYAGWTVDAGFGFTDIAGHWAEDAVNYVVAAELFNGISETAFNPDGNMNRAMLVTVLWRLDGKVVMADGKGFSDVKESAYYHDAVVWAAENGIVKGYSTEEFAPDDNITREQLSAVLYRYAEFKGYDVAARADLNHYSDLNKVSAYAADSMSWAKASGLINGRTADTLVPQGNATRAEVASVLQRYCNQFIN
ncbi:MAG: S-layer homology domain-containing protein [Bacillota bacterium]